MNKKRAKNRPRPTPVSAEKWQDLAADPSLYHEYNQLAVALQQAQSTAMQKASRYGGHSSDYLDMSRAFSIIDRSPQLIPYLSQIAKQSDSVPTAYTITEKKAPTGTTGPQPESNASIWSGSSSKQVDAIHNAQMLREWADSNEWTRAAINVRRQQIGRANIAVVPFNERKPYNKTLAKRVQLLMDQPNELRQNYYELMSGAMDDLLVIDRAVILKNMTVDRKPTHIYNEDGACIKIYPEWSGNPNEPRYLYENRQHTRKVPLRNDEAIVMMANPATYRFGLSPVQVLKNTIQADLTATRSAMQMVDMKPPPHLIQLTGATQSQLEQIRARYEADIAGRKEVFWVGGQQPANVQSLVFSARDNQWLEWQVYLARKIAVIFQISPQQLGITFDINKATASSQQEIFEDTGLIPLLLLIEEYFNREIMGDFANTLPDGRADFSTLNLRILYPEVTEADRQMHAERAINMATSGMAGLPSMTINQVLAMFGEEAVPGGNTFYVDNATMGPIPWLSYDGDFNGYGPSSTSGVQGGQDASGGPDVDENDPQDGDGKGSYKPPAAQQTGPTPPKGDGSASSNSSDTKPAASPKSVQPLRHKHNNRQFGKRLLTIRQIEEIEE